VSGDPEDNTMRFLSRIKIARVKNVWGNGAAARTWRSAEPIHWTQHPKVQERLNLLVSGERSRNRFNYFMDRYLQGRMPVERALTLGCGHGELERGLSLYGFSSRHEGMDISDGAVAEAARLAKEARLNNLVYSVGDLNCVQLPKECYDVIFGIGSVHHVSALEHLFEQVSRSLKPKGYFFLDEYIGPSQFQWPDEQLAAINAQIAVLPERFKPCINRPKTLKGPVARVSIREINSFDPSEAIRSSEILPLVSKFFDVVDVKGCGGSLLHLLLDEIAGNFDENDSYAMNYLQDLFDLEDRLIANGTLKHDFAIIIAVRR
jgi:O-antigen biosynthesis protein